jgi:membrane dipeptidase
MEKGAIEMPKSNNWERAIAIYNKAVVWDAHSGFEPHPKADLRKLSIWRQAGVDYLSIDVGFDVMDWRDTVKTLAAFRRWILNNQDEYLMVEDVDSIHQAKKDGKLAVTFDIEGMNALDGSVDMVDLYHTLGVHQIAFAYNLNNLAGGGCHDEDIGLTNFGRAVIQRMNRLGLLIDCSHASYRTTIEAIEYSRDPVVFSHSNPRELCDHERNILDDQIITCAEKNGIIGVTGPGIFLGDNDISTKRLANHIDYLVELIGPEHIGIGLDYAFEGDSDLDELLVMNPNYWPPEQYNVSENKFVSPDQLLPLVEELLERRYSEENIMAILGENFLRLADKVWK